MADELPATKKALELAEMDNNSLLLNIKKGPMQMINKIAEFADILLIARELKLMEERSFPL